MEIKAATGPFPITDEEKKLGSQAAHLTVLVLKVAEPWMSKRATKTLDNLMMAHTQLYLVRDWLADADLEPAKRKRGVAAIFYHCEFKFEPFAIVKLKDKSLWDRLRKSLGKEHKVQVEELYTALKVYVEPVALQFISAK